MKAVNVTRGLFWFLIGTAFVISGIIYTVKGALSGFEDEWYAGPIAIVLGIVLAGYVRIFRAMRQQRTAYPHGQVDQT
jgi:hypothetical protein